MDIAIIADTHLTPLAPQFAANSRAALAWAAGAAFIVHLGDLTADGVLRPAELAYAMEAFSHAKRDVLMLPGNHDIGDVPAPPSHRAEPLVTPERLHRFRDRAGPDRWVRSAAGWRLIGINAQLLGLGEAAEEEQFAWLAATLADTAGPVGLFLHKPLFRTDWHEYDPHPRYVPRHARLRLRSMIEGHGLRFVISGHAHQSRRLEVEGVEHLWVGSTAFLIPDLLQEPIGAKCLGAARLTLGQDRFEAELATVPGLVTHDLLDFAAVYPEVAKIGHRDGHPARAPE